VLDESRLTVLRDVQGEDGRPFLFEFIELFEADARQRLEQLRSLISTGALEGLRRMAHTLKGSCRNIGAMAMAEACLKLEKAGDHCDAGDAAAMVTEIEAEYERVRQRLPELLK